MPLLGLGVYQASPRETTSAVLQAFRLGYRHVDTASLYGNEREVGVAVRECGLARDEVFITTKLWNSDQGHAKTRTACLESQKKLGIGAIDLYLIHWPQKDTRVESWKAMCELRDEGVVKSIGVSNFTVRHLEELMAKSDVVPAVNQVEMSPFCAQRELVKFCEKHGIAVEAYSPLTRGEKLGNRVVTEIAGKHGRTPAQIVLRWAVQQGITVLPKSVRAERIQENAGIFDFELDEEDMKALAGLDEGFRTCWDPTGMP
jgi:diketogulonate reductase-like aldo/keto reductase